MATPTTTQAAVRSALVGVINAISPTSNADTPFKHTRQETPDFRVWADLNDGAVLREYEIRSTGWEPVGAWDGDIQRRLAGIEISVAYPHEWGRYRAGHTSAGNTVNAAAMHDIIEEDTDDILRVAGVMGRGNYPSGAVPVESAAGEVEDLEGVSFASIAISYEYYAQL